MQQRDGGRMKRLRRVTTDQRSAEATEWRRLYRTARWKHLRLRHLAEHPLCKLCLEQHGRVTAGKIVDHVKAHKGNLELFFDAGNLQTLCSSCHSSTKAIVEHRGHALDVDINGMPTDPEHPWNKGRGGR